MDGNERQVIEELFGKLRTVEAQGSARDPEAEAFIAEQLRAQPGAAYYMAQTIIVQERALEKAQAQLQGGQQRTESGGFLSNLFGSGQREQPPRQPVPTRGGPWGQPQRGGGFLAGAAQTAVGVAGGVVAGSLLMDAFTTSPAEAAAAEADTGADTASDSSGFEDSGGDFGGGDFGDI